VLIMNEVNAAAVQRPAFGLIGWPRNYLLLGLPLLEAMAPEEALAVVAHEYGHLAGSHGHFSAFIYRLRLTWGTVQAHIDQVQGWLGKLVVPLVRWYVPYFNAYTFVLARANEYEADAASAELVGAQHAAAALKRVNLVTPLHQQFLDQTFGRIVQDPTPPADLMQQWARLAITPPAEPEGQRWLSQALDYEAHYADSHPTLRARLAALDTTSPANALLAPPPLTGPSAAQSWLGTLLPSLRQELATHWATQVQTPWAERHAQAQQELRQLAELRALPEPSAEQQLEQLRLTMRLEPQTDVVPPLAAYNASHPEQALALFLEGTARLDQNDREGLALLERAMTLDPEATKPACERAHAWLMQQQEKEAANRYADRWRTRDALETQRQQQLNILDPASNLTSHALGDDTLKAIRALLSQPQNRRYIRRVFLARRIIPADPSMRPLLMGVELTWWGRRRGQQNAVVERLAKLEWPQTMVIATLDGKYRALGAKFKAMAGAAVALG
jgi:hypothetical protein